MNFKLFNILYSEALGYDDLDMYIAERGWQDWMDDYDNAGDVLKNIYTLAHSTLQETRDLKNISRAALSRMVNIPLRTLENWDSGKRESPLYVKVLIDYAMFNY